MNPTTAPIEIPIISLSDYITNDPTTSTLTISQLHTTCTTAGFLQISEGTRFLQGVNQWPEEPRGFRAVYEEFYAGVKGMSKVLFRIMAESLRLEASYFDDFAEIPDVGELEVLHKATETWLHVDPIPGAFVVNIGDLMQRWTNDRYKSTMHRVIIPKNGKDRYSCAVFNDGVLDQVVECIPSCLEPGEKPLYEPLKVENHLVRKYLQTYGDVGVSFKV